MKYINVRQLLNNYKEATKELPVAVTRRGIPIFIVTSVEAYNWSENVAGDLSDSGVKDLASPEKFSKKNSEKKPVIVTLEDVKKIDVIPDPILDNAPDLFKDTILCAAPNHKCKEWATKKVNFESPDHEDMTLYFCDEHYKKLKDSRVEIYAEENI